MKNLFKTKKNTLITYIVLNSIILLLSFVFLVWNIYELSFVLGVSIFFDTIYLYLILNFGKNRENKNGLDKNKNILAFTFLRTMIEVVSLATCALGMYFIPSLILSDIYTKLRYAFILLGLIPYFSAVLMFYLNSKTEDQ